MNATAERDGFADFERRRDGLLELIGRLTPIVTGLDVETSHQALGRLHQRVVTDTFKIMIVGEFKRGKSTFINALLGERVLPMHTLPCTAIIHEVKWSQDRRAVLFPMAGRADLGGPREIPVDDLANHVTIPEGDQHSSSPYARAEVYWPLPLCQHRVEIIDSPGLNEAPEREMITLEYLERADALVVVMLATSPLSLKEQSFLDFLQAKGHEAFFIFNRINDVEPDEVEEAKRGILRRLGRFLPRDHRVFFVDARRALRARIAHDEDEFLQSGVAQVEHILEDYLARERGRVKLVVGATQLKGVVSETRRNITTQLGMLRRSADELRQAYEDAQGPLNQLERSRLNVLRRVDAHLAETVRQADTMAREFYRSAAGDMEAWVLELDLENRLKGIRGLNPIGQRKRAEAAQAEIREKLSTRLQTTVTRWLEHELCSRVESRLADLETEIGDDLRRLVESADEIRYTLAAVPAPITGPTISSAAERVAAAGTGLVLGGPGMALVGANLGFQGVVKAVMPTIGVAVVGAVLGVATLPLAAAIIAVSVFQNDKLLDSVEKKIKADVARAYRTHVHENLDSLVGELVAQVSTQLGTMREIIGQGVEVDLRAVRQEVEAALRKKEAGESATLTAVRALEQYADELETVDDALATFIRNVAL